MMYQWHPTPCEYCHSTIQHRDEDAWEVRAPNALPAEILDYDWHWRYCSLACLLAGMAALHQRVGNASVQQTRQQTAARTPASANTPNASADADSPANTRPS